MGTKKVIRVSRKDAQKRREVRTEKAIRASEYLSAVSRDTDRFFHINQNRGVIL